MGTSGGHPGGLCEESERFDEIVLRDEFVVAEEGLRLEDTVEAPGLALLEPQSLLQVVLDELSCLLDMEELIELERDDDGGLSQVPAWEEHALRLSILVCEPMAESSTRWLLPPGPSIQALYQRFPFGLVPVYFLRLEGLMHKISLRVLC